MLPLFYSFPICSLISIFQKHCWFLKKLKLIKLLQKSVNLFFFIIEIHVIFDFLFKFLGLFNSFYQNYHNYIFFVYDVVLSKVYYFKRVFFIFKPADEENLVF